MSDLIPKELSWLSFNGRVLQEAADPSVPLIERVHFLGIYSNNQDEFFKVRVAELKRQAMIVQERDAQEELVTLLKQVQHEAARYQMTLNEIFRSLVSELEHNGIFLRDEKNINDSQRLWVEHYFKRHVLKHINPVIIDEDTDLVLIPYRAHARSAELLRLNRNSHRCSAPFYPHAL